MAKNYTDSPNRFKFWHMSFQHKKQMIIAIVANLGSLFLQKIMIQFWFLTFIDRRAKYFFLNRKTNWIESIFLCQFLVVNFRAKNKFYEIVVRWIFVFIKWISSVCLNESSTYFNQFVYIGVDDDYGDVSLYLFCDSVIG